MMRRCYWFSTALVPVLLVWGGCGQEQDPGREGPGSEVVVAAPGEPAAPVIPEEQPVAGVEPARSAPASPAAGLRDASTALSDPLSRSAASERLSLRLRGVLGVRGLLEEGPSALAATLLPAVQGKAAPTGAGGGLGVRRQGLQGADGAAAAEPALPPGEGIGCWEELAADGTRVE
ncbi:MAG: hypothetical protein FJ125_14920, partial [Deltaproteobacteria bacterium]|nr:hypothetical protein [Deltaproteobacteria bacterium]